MAQLGAVVVGTGFGVITHVRALQNAGIAVRALVGRNEAKAKERAALFDIPHALTEFEHALALDGLDIVSIATPPYAHGSYAIAAARAGKHLLCEKPFARDLDEARAMLSAAEAAGVVHLLGTEFRFGTPQATLTRALRQGLIGEPRHASFALEIPTLVDPAAGLPEWWEDAAQGGGWLGAYGTHVIDQIRDCLGEFTAVSAQLRTLSPRPAMTADDTYTVQFELANGCTGTMHSSCAIGGSFVATTKVVGSSGVIWIEGNDVRYDTGDGPQTLPPPPDLPDIAPVPPPMTLMHTTYDYWHSMGIDLEPYTRVCRVLRDRIEGRDVATDPRAATFHDGVANQAVVDAIRRSNATRRWVAL